MRTLILNAGILLTVATTAFAASPKLGDYIENETQAIATALEQNDTTDGPCCERWFFRRFTFRVRPNVTFTAGIAKIGIVPDIELLFDRALPEGWVPYKP